MLRAAQAVCSDGLIANGDYGDAALLPNLGKKLNLGLKIAHLGVDDLPG